MGCSELEEAQPARRASPEESPAALESLAQLELGGGGCANCNTLVQAPGSNPTVPSTNTEPHRSYSSLVAAQTSACLSGCQNSLGASRRSLQQPLLLENCCLFLLSPPQLPALTLSCSQHVLFIQLETPTRKQTGTGLPLVPVSLAHRSHCPGQEPVSLCHTQSCSPTAGVQQQVRGVGIHLRI